MSDSGTMHEILEALGIEATGERGSDEIQAHCPMHEKNTGKVDNNPSWWINAESGVSICFSCDYRASLPKLVADVLELETKQGAPDWTAAEKWLENYQDSLEMALRKLDKREWVTDLPAPVAMTEARLAVFSEPPKWALKARKLDAESCRTYGVLWDAREDCWITPLREPEGFKLMGWQAKGQGNRLFRNRPPGMQKTRTLFGIDVFKGGDMVVVESPLDCVRLRTAGVEGAVATCGAIISDEQIRLMLTADSITLAMDNPKLDRAGAKAVGEMFDASLQRGFDFRAFSYGDTGMKDPGDMSKKQIRQGIKNSVHSVYGKEALLAA